MLKKKSIIPTEQNAKYDKWHFSPAVESGGFLFVSGCTGTKPDGTISTDIREQFRQAFKNVEMSLTEAGLTFSDVVDMTTYHIGPLSRMWSMLKMTMKKPLWHQLMLL